MEQGGENWEGKWKAWKVNEKEKTQGGPEEFGMTREDGPVETREKPPGGREFIRSHKILAFPETKIWEVQ